MASSCAESPVVKGKEQYIIMVSVAVLISGVAVLGLCREASEEHGEFRAAPVYESLCRSHSKCPVEHDDKACCPTADGLFLDCCDPISVGASLSTFQGMCYNPAPVKFEKELPSDDYMAPFAEPLWGTSPQGSRDDLATIRNMGVNVVRLYGNDPRLDSKQFLDRAHELGLGVIVAFSNYPYTQDPTQSCAMDLPFDCFSLVSSQYISMIANGFAKKGSDGYRTYHPAIKAIILMNEPELAMRYKEKNNEELRSKGYYTKALLSALDGALEAERGMKIKPNKDGYLPPFTVTYSFDICQNCISEAKGNRAANRNVGGVNALPFMYDFVLGSMNPSLYGYEAQGAVPLKYGMQNRLALSFNTQDDSAAVCAQLFTSIADSPLRNFPLFIGEFHGPDWSASQLKIELKTMREYIQGTKTCGNIKIPIVGMSVMEFQVAYFKGGNDKQMEYGIYELGSRKLGKTMKAEATNWTAYDVWCLHQKQDESSESFPKAVTSAFGGKSTPDDHDCPRDTKRQTARLSV